MLNYFFQDFKISSFGMLEYIFYSGNIFLKNTSNVHATPGDQNTMFSRHMKNNTFG